MPTHPYATAHPSTLGVFVVVIALLVFLLCWLYNTHRLGKFKKPSRTAPGISNMTPKSTPQSILLIFTGLAAGILISLAIRFVF